MKRTAVKKPADVKFSREDIEAWIIRQLGNPPGITQGDTTFDIRKERIRAYINSRDMGCIPASARTGESWASAFQRFYGEPLQPKGKF